MEEGTWRQFDAEQERPYPPGLSGEGSPYKPKVKWGCGGRESEGPIVLLRLGETREEGRGPAVITLAAGR
jgi:hypothetical protein